MFKVALGLIGIALFFACLATYSFQNILFPAALAVAVDQAAAESIPGYAGEFVEWMLREAPAGESSGYSASVLTPFDGYAGAVGFYSCGPYFIDTAQVVISSRFHAYRGWDADCGCELWHGGIDYATVSPDRTPDLLAPMAGKVVFADWNAAGYGNLVVIENDGVRVYLAHLSLISVSAGMILQAGDFVGKIGSTGNSTGPHLHFEVRIQDPRNEAYGLVVDPSAVLLPGQTEACNWAPGEGRYNWNLK